MRLAVAIPISGLVRVRVVHYAQLGWLTVVSSLALAACSPEPDEPKVAADSDSDYVVTGDDTAEDTGDEPGPVSIVEVTNAADVATAGLRMLFAKSDTVVVGYHYIAPGDTDTIEADVEGQAWLGFDDADGNCAAFEVWLDYDTPVAVTITGFAGTWSDDSRSCE